MGLQPVIHAEEFTNGEVAELQRSVSKRNTPFLPRVLAYLASELWSSILSSFR